MFPASSVSGLYLGHPMRYFNVGTITEEQLNDYVRRSGKKPPSQAVDRWKHC